MYIDLGSLGGNYKKLYMEIAIKYVECKNTALTRSEMAQGRSGQFSQGSQLVKMDRIYQTDEVIKNILERKMDYMHEDMN